jgi:hypothetical protein
MTGRIFISYRRADSQYATDQIYDLLVRQFGVGTVFMDIDAIPLGVNFRDYIDQQVSTSDIVLAVIGDHWLNATDLEGSLRLHNPNDFVRLEVEAALKQDIKLIPLFIGGVEALPAGQLPDSLKELSMLNAIRIRRSTDFVPDVEKLIRGLEHIRAEQASVRQQHKVALEAIGVAVEAVSAQLGALNDLPVRELRQRKDLLEQTEMLAEQVSALLAEPARHLRLDTAPLEAQADRLEDEVFELQVNVEERRRSQVQTAAQQAAETERRTQEQRAAEQAAASKAEQERQSHEAARRAENQSRLSAICSLTTELLEELERLSGLTISERRTQAAIKRSGTVTMRSLQRVLASPEELLHADIGLYQGEYEQLRSNWTDFTAQVDERKLIKAAEEEHRQQAAIRPAEVQPSPAPPREEKKTTAPHKVPVWVWGGGAIILVALVFGLPRVLGGGLPLSQAEKTATQAIEPTNTQPAPSTQTAALTETPPPTATNTLIPSATPVDEQTVHYQDLISEIQTTVPVTFQDDFSVVNSRWGITSERSYPEMHMDSGVLVMEDELTPSEPNVAADWPDMTRPGETFPNSGIFYAQDFLVEFDAAFPLNPVDEIGFEFRGPSYDDRGYRFVIFRNNTWKLFKIENDSERLVGGSYQAWSATSSRHIRLLLVDDTCVVFVNDELVFASDGFPTEVRRNQFWISGNLDRSEAYFDNVKFWNLDNVEIIP